MKSIRASLIVYFWLLLAVGLGAASLFVYSIASSSRNAELAAKRELLVDRHKDDVERVRRRFEDGLLQIARDVARSAVTLHQWDTTLYGRLLALGLMNPTNGHLTGPIWAAEVTYNGPPGSLGSQMRGNISRKITFEDEELLRATDADDHDLIQINSYSGQTWRSRSLGEQQLPFDPAESARADLLATRVDDVRLADGRMVHRVTFKYPARHRYLQSQVPFAQGQSGGQGGRRGRQDGPRGGGGGPPPADRPPGNRQMEMVVPWIVVQCAAEPAITRDAAIAELNQKFDEDVTKQEADARKSLADLRKMLVAIALVSCLLTIAGGYVIVGLGLIPLKKVTIAVSQVSPRDFKLPLPADEPLPRELAPIRDRLQGTLDELRKAFEREKQAAADISHELRTPVASMLTTVEVALRKPRSAEEYRQTLEDCRGVARQMRHLVERLMALARLDAGSDKLRPRPVDVGELVQECAALVKPLAGERGLELRVHCPKPVVWTTDPDKLREVLVNLLHNAVQYNRPDGAIDVSAQSADGWLDVQVHDTGVGISKEAFDHIFERFYRADPSRHADDLHAGLGLSIVKGYVGLLGGTISVDSLEGQGSTFRVRLPNAANAA
jgi:signal transduction histidine kinase